MKSKLEFQIEIVSKKAYFKIVFYTETENK